MIVLGWFILMPRFENEAATKVEVKIVSVSSFCPLDDFFLSKRHVYRAVMATEVKQYFCSLLTQGPFCCDGC